MPRHARIVLPGFPLHIVQRGHNRQPCFLIRPDFERFLHWLKYYAKESACAIHSYVLMTNHVHLLVTPTHVAGPAMLMKGLTQRYAQYFNYEYGCTGSVWQGRFKSCLVQTEQYLLTCYRYIELNPVNARMVDRPQDYPWSSHNANAYGHHSRIVSAHPEYLSLGKSDPERLEAYRALFNVARNDRFEHLRYATQCNFAFGDEAFTAEMAEKCGRNPIRLKRFSER